MQNITHGQLRVLSTSHIYTFPAPGSQAENDNDMPDLKAELRVVNDVFWLRLCTMSDLGTLDTSCTSTLRVNAALNRICRGIYVRRRRM
jgi:hypothetical protein